ncbi:MAG: glycosyltransferase family 2 protein, partial [Balneolaceae bacterium]
ASDLDYGTLEETFPDVTFLKNEENHGACYSRNRGLSSANGEYINFLDDDDELYPEKIKLQVKKFQDSDNTNLGMVTAHAHDIRSGKKILKKNDVSGNIYSRILYSYILSGTETMLFKTSHIREIGGFDENLQSNQEYDVLIRFCEKYEVDYVDKVLSKEHRSENQISLNFGKKMHGAKFLFKKHSDRYKSFGFLFWLKMQLKLKILVIRFWIGKYFGENVYRMLLRE